MSFIDKLLEVYVPKGRIEKIESGIKESKKITEELRTLTEKYNQSIKELEDKKNFIKNIIEVVPGSIYVYNIKENKNIWTNKEIINELGYSKEEVFNMSSSLLKTIMYEEDYKYYCQDTYPRYKELKDDELLEKEYRFIKKDGTLKWFNIRESVFTRDENGDVVEILGIMQDINKIKKAQERIKLNTEILKKANDSIVITDKEGNIIFVNDKFCEYSKYTQEEVLGKNPRILKSGKHDAKFYEDMWKMLSVGKTWHGDIINKAKDGTLFTEKTTITPVGNGKIQYYFAIKVKI